MSNRISHVLEDVFRGWSWSGVATQSEPGECLLQPGRKQSCSATQHYPTPGKPVAIIFQADGAVQTTAKNTGRNVYRRRITVKYGR